MTQQPLGFFDHLTHKANLKHTRYGWLRLTPAYSVHLVADILNATSTVAARVLDPFCGTGTTALVCAEQGIDADTTDINPFLVWLATVKTRTYSSQDIESFQEVSTHITHAILDTAIQNTWVPALHQIEKWWDEQSLSALSRAMSTIKNVACNISTATSDLLKIAFCRTMITCSNASFNHQSMSFKKQRSELLIYTPEENISEIWRKATVDISRAALSEIAVEPNVLLCDARQLGQKLPTEHYTCVITSPPYPNRMSYIRELRPYMYWLGYLQNGKEAGELDWQAIGGTWGAATSKLAKWQPEGNTSHLSNELNDILANIARSSPLLSQYVHKYFCDMVTHIHELLPVLKPGAGVHYIVGNSKFYDVILPVERIFADIFQTAGLEKVAVTAIRKRTSKKELYEYIVSANKP